MKKERIFWGLCLVLFGVILIVGKLGYLGNFNAFTLIATILLVIIILKSILHLNFAGILFPIAFIGILFDQELGITAITPWTILLAALLGTIGLSLIFHKRHQHFGYDLAQKGIKEDEFEVIDVDDESCINCVTRFSGSVKYINSDDFRKANISCSFGGVKVYFDRAVIKGEQAVIHIENSFGGVELYIPKDWRVVNNMSVSMAGVTEKNRNSGVNAKTLVLTGNVTFGGVDITFI